MFARRARRYRRGLLQPAPKRQVDQCAPASSAQKTTDKAGMSFEINNAG